MLDRTPESMSPRHAALIAMTRPREEAVARLSAWLRAMRASDAWVGDAESVVYDIAGQWHREAMERAPRDDARLRDAVRLYGVLTEQQRPGQHDLGWHWSVSPAACYCAEAIRSLGIASGSCSLPSGAR